MRVAAGIEYDGTAYNGWQTVETGRGVQAVVERAFATVADHPVDAVCAGRTDTGVHATGQVIHFETDSDRSERSWLLGGNSNLPDDVSIAWIQPVSDDFHARHSAIGRTYRYLVFNRLVRSALVRNRAWWVHEPLDVESMASAGQHLLGEHDFSAFRASGCQARTPKRHITSLTVTRQGPWVVITVSANAFLQHMVRNVTGLLVEIGRGDSLPDRAHAVLQSRDRNLAGVAAPAQGLTLVAVDYPADCNIPATTVPRLMPAVE